MISKHMQKLGHKARDCVTGFEGIVTTVSFDLYGCVQVVVTPEADKAGKVGDSHWFDIKRIELTSKKPVMPVPDFNQPEIGAAEKPPGRYA